MDDLLVLVVTTSVEMTFHCISTHCILWLKNQMVIGNDPKYRQINNQGVCSLEIRKPSSFDGGIYTCRAKNSLGEATVACRREVKRKYRIVCYLPDTLICYKLHFQLIIVTLIL